jgi:serine/threonine protein kinase
MSAPLPRQIGRYEIEERLGQGGMGQVYLGRDPQTGERAAIKVLSAALAQEEGFLERFQREIEALRKFSHPHIVRLFEDGVDNGAPWFAMEYVPGGTLLDLLRSERRLDWRRAYALAIETCSALKAAHDQGVVHRDLKPSNLLIDPDEHVHLTDFGVAQSYAASQRLTVTGGVIGTAEYMSPEQAAGQRATRQSDLYSLGAVMYAMVTGRTPFTGNSTVEVMHKHRYGLFDRPRAVLPDLPREVDDTICKLLEKNPDKRYPTPTCCCGTCSSSLTGTAPRASLLPPLGPPAWKPARPPRSSPTSRGTWTIASGGSLPLDANASPSRKARAPSPGPKASGKARPPWSPPCWGAWASSPGSGPGPPPKSGCLSRGSN